MEAERRIDADKVVDVLDRIVSERGSHPEFVRCDNGPEMTSAALRDWCRFSRTGAAFIERGSPGELVHDVEQLHHPTVVSDVELEVKCPHMIGTLCPQPVTRDGRFPTPLALATLLRDPEPFLAPQPLHPACGSPTSPPQAGADGLGDTPTAVAGARTPAAAPAAPRRPARRPGRVAASNGVVRHTGTPAAPKYRDGPAACRPPGAGATGSPVSGHDNGRGDPVRPRAYGLASGIWGPGRNTCKRAGRALRDEL
jgi:hypothetical protein